MAVHADDLAFVSPAHPTQMPLLLSVVSRHVDPPNQQHKQDAGRNKQTPSRTRRPQHPPCQLNWLLLKAKNTRTQAVMLGSKQLVSCLSVFRTLRRLKCLDADRLSRWVRGVVEMSFVATHSKLQCPNTSHYDQRRSVTGWSVWGQRSP